MFESAIVWLTTTLLDIHIHDFNLSHKKMLKN